MVGESEEPEKASWSQEHHLKDEEVSINTINKHELALARKGIRPESQACSVAKG